MKIRDNWQPIKFLPDPYSCYIEIAYNHQSMKYFDFFNFSYKLMWKIVYGNIVNTKFQKLI